MEFNSDPAHGGLTAGAADFRTAGTVALDGKAFGDGQVVHAHLERAAVLTVQREEASLQRQPGDMDSAVAYRREIIFTSFGGT